MTDSFQALLAEHADCTWEQIDPCVYCADHHVRLYQGTLPNERRVTPRCAPGEHDWDEETGLGFYMVCNTCGEREWCE